ncbi:lactonase family protein [Actinoalloteichus caeruleus]|uniref:6-phosphogluconolactonase, cycloisomerase 2 family n=1 Tax=Actinoalloteichus caeruleus DSM 43889 TaxID=1120930 RepID=A0ABT1JF34_ACTCY|nr:lactonase family protein [Actinoalloteichus caeruleus]MCP2330386.1 6-phosphogluconolactonase, cycloisomerase 2 family [Actinoalloteichus caeruleus DSM 43889]
MSAETNRRRFLLTTSAAVGAALLPIHHGAAGAAAGASAPAGTGADPTLTPVYLGGFSWTHPPGGDLEISGYDQGTGELARSSTVGGVPDPSFLAFSPSGRFLYATNELVPEGRVTALSLANPHRPTVLNSEPTHGAGPTHLSVTSDGRFLLTANYTDGSVVVHPLGADGRLRPATHLVRHPGGTRDPHAHQILPDPSGRWVLAVDLGADAVFVYTLDARAGRLRAHQRCDLPPGTGPRHLAFHPDGRRAYLLGELDSTVTVLGWDATTGRITPGGTTSTRHPTASGDNFPAEIAVSEDGRFVYASNRGDDDIAVFATSTHDTPGRHAPSHESLALLDNTPTGGAWPRHFALDPGERALYVANQDSGTVTRLTRDARTGLLTHGTPALAVPGVCFLAFHP